MHHGRWNDGWNGGSGVWMVLMMVAFVAVIAWVIISLSHRNSRPTIGEPGSAAAGPMSPQAILAERLARGEIEPDEYNTRLAVLLAVPPVRSR